MIGDGDRLAEEGIAWLYALTVAGYPLVSVAPVVGGFPSRFASIPYRALVLGLATVIVVLVGLRGRRIRVSAAVWVPLALFWALYLLRLSVDTVLAPASLRLSPYEYVLYIVGVTLVPMLAFLVGPTGATLHRALSRTTLLAGVAALALLTLGARRLLEGDLAGFLLQRLQTEALNPVSLGHLGVSLMILTLFQLLAPKLPRRGVLLLMGFGLGTLAVILSASRASFLVLGMVLPVQLVIAARRGARKRAFLVAAVVAATMVGGATIVRDRIGLAAVARLTSILDPDDPSTGGRIEVMTDAWGQYLGAPAIGAGLEEARTGFYPHNVVLEAFMATGIVGGFALIVVLVLSVGAVWRVLLHVPRHAWVALLAIQYLLAAQVSGSLWGSPEMWTFLAAIFAVAATVEGPGEPVQVAGVRAEATVG